MSIVPKSRTVCRWCNYHAVVSFMFVQKISSEESWYQVNLSSIRMCQLGCSVSPDGRCLVSSCYVLSGGSPSRLFPLLISSMVCRIARNDARNGPVSSTHQASLGLWRSWGLQCLPRWLLGFVWYNRCHFVVFVSKMDAVVTASWPSSSHLIQ